MRMRMGVLIALTMVLVIGQSASGSAPANVLLQWSRSTVQVAPAHDGTVAVKLEGGVSASAPGTPDLPWWVVQVAVPSGERVESWSWKPGPADKLASPVRPAPAWLDQPTEAGGPIQPPPDPAVYSGTALFPSEAVRFDGTQARDGAVVAIFRICPFQWTPADQSLWWTPSGVLQVTFAGGEDPTRFLSAPRRASPDRGLSGLRRAAPPAVPAGGQIFKLKGGLGITSMPSLDSSPVEYVIVTDTTLVDKFQALVDWKNQTGVPAAVRTVQWIDRAYPQGVDLQDKIRLFLRDAYLYWGTTTALMGGDPSLVPVRYAKCYVYDQKNYGRDIATDYYYACLDGNWNANGNNLYGEDGPVTINNHVIQSDFPDLLPDLKVGRISATDRAQVDSYFNKYWRYVKNPNTDATYLKSILTLGEVLFDADWQIGDADSCSNGAQHPCVSTDGANDCFGMIDTVSASPYGSFFQFDQLYERDYWWNPRKGINSRPLNKANVNGSLNYGRNLVFQVGHGDRDRWAIGRDRFLVGDVNQLTNGTDTNGNKWSGMAMAVNCNSAAVDADCLGEAWQFAPNGGGLIYLGSTNLDFPATARDFQNYFFYDWLYRGSGTPGDAFFAAQDSMAVKTGNDRIAGRFLLFSLMFLGDPDMTVWNNIPTQPTVTADPAFTNWTMGSGPVTFTVIQGAAQALEGARVCLYKAGDAMSVGVTDAQGHCTLAFNPTSTGPFYLTVTHPHAVPYQNIGQVVPASNTSFVALQDYSIIDDGSNGTSGNGDGLFEVGETVALKLSVADQSSVQARNVVGHIAINGSYGTLTVDTLSTQVDIGTLDPGVPVQVPAFLIRATDHAGAFGGRRITLPLQLTLRADDAVRVKDLTPTIFRPDLLLTHTRLWETGGYNPQDSIPNNGEQMSVQFQLYNKGRGTWNSLRAHVDSVYAGSAQFTTPTGGFPGLAPGTSAYSAPIAFQVNQAAGFKVRLSVEDTLTSPPSVVLQKVLDLSRRPRQLPADSISTVGTPTTIQVNWDALLLEPNVWGYHITTSDNPDSGFVPLEVGYTDSVRTYTQEGIQPLSRHYYKVAVVNTSGIEGRWSPAVEGVASPGSAAGWPNLLAVGGDICPAIEHLKNWGKYEIVNSSDQLYCFGGDGSDYYDGDGSPSTRGILTRREIGVNFNCKSAICDLYGDGNKEIIAVATNDASPSNPPKLLVLNRLGQVLWSATLSSGQALSAPAVGDIDGDGRLEIVLFSGRNLYAFTRDGQPFGGRPNGVLLQLQGDNNDVGYQYGSVALANLDSDPALEIIFSPMHLSDGSAAGVWAIKAKDNSGNFAVNLPGFPFKFSSKGVPGQLTNGSVAIGDFTSSDGNEHAGLADGKPDIAIETSGYIWALDPWAPGLDKLAWYRQIEVRNGKEEAPLTSSPAIGNITGLTNTNNVPANAVVVGGAKGRLYVLDYQGQPLPNFHDTVNGTPLPYRTLGSPTARMGSPILADLDGDRHPDVIVGDNEGNVYVLRSEDGLPMGGFPYKVPGGKIGQGLAVWDVDRDGHPNLVIQSQLVLDVSVLDFPTCPFDTSATVNPWPEFRHDTRNTGSMATDIVDPTPVETVTLQAQAGGGLSADLRWQTALPWQEFTLERKLDPGGEWEQVGTWRPDQIEESPGTFHTVDAVPGEGTWRYQLFGRGSDGVRQPIGDAVVTINARPTVFRLHRALPNPFSPSTGIQCDLPQSGPVDIRIVDLSGRTVRRLWNGTAKAGVLSLTWNGTDERGRLVGSGIYFVVAQAASQGRQTEKVVVMR